MKKFFTLILTFILSTILFFPSRAASTTEVTMLVTNPAEDMQTQINISYHALMAGTKIEYTLESDVNFANKTTISPTCTADTFSNSEGITKNYDHCIATITNLTPNTKYMYRVGKDIYTNPHYFLTAGAESFSFLHITDIHSYEGIPGRIQAANNVINKALEYDANLAFTLASGDLTAYGSYYQEWVDFFNLTGLEKHPLVSTPGNHDFYDKNTSGTLLTRDTRFYNKVVYNPQNGASSTSNSTHFFTYNNVLFISIDSETMAASNASLAEQQAWFKNVVSENRRTFTIVYTHRPFYTGDGLNAGQATTMRQGWQKIFDACGVDLLLAGHNHVYARTKPVHSAFDATKNGLGTIYITGTQLGDRYVTEPGTPMSAVEVVKLGKIDGGNLIKVYDDHIDIRFFNTAGDTLDHHTITAKETLVNKESHVNELKFTRTNSKPEEVQLVIPATSLGVVDKVEVIDEFAKTLLKIDFPETTSYKITNFDTKTLDYKVSVKLTYRDKTTKIKDFIFDNLRYNYGSFRNIRVNSGTTYLHWDARLANNVVSYYEIYIDGRLVATIDDLSVGQYKLNGYSMYSPHVGYFEAYNQKGDQLFSKAFSFGGLDIWSTLFSAPYQQFYSLIDYLNGN